jgi:hypothetical protein
VDQIAKLVVVVTVEPEAADLLPVLVDDFIDHLRHRGVDVPLVPHLFGQVRAILDPAMLM